jgi:23S rRNA pseudouridine1911/1915/1917 synthase
MTIEEPKVTFCVPRRDRVEVFRRFLLQTFSQIEGVVLDVAGGKGDLSWLLANASGIDSVVVDPRPTDHRKISRTALWYWERRDDPVAQQLGQDHQVLSKMDLAPPFVVPRHLQVFLDSDLVSALESTNVLEGMDAWPEFWEKACSRPDDLEPPGHHTPKRYCPQDSRRSRVRDAMEALEILKSTKLILGFHPDEATEPCIDLALQLRIPFAVCPCCVFAKAFPDRKSDEKRIARYSDFLHYLSQKHSGIRMGQLDFGLTGGYERNDVLFMLPEDFNAPSPPLGVSPAVYDVQNQQDDKHPSPQQDDCNGERLNNGREFRYAVKGSQSGMKLLDVLATWPHSTRLEWEEHCARGRVELDGRVGSPSDLVTCGAIVLYRRPPWYEPAGPWDLRIGFSDLALTLSSKPSGLAVMPSQMYYENTVMGMLQRSHVSIGADEEPPSPVHRLGVGTSGVLLCGRTHEAKSVLSKAMQERRIKKTYRALLRGIVQEDSLDVKCPIGPVPHASFGGTVNGALPEGGANAKPAHSIMNVIHRDTVKGIRWWKLGYPLVDHIRFVFTWLTSGIPLSMTLSTKAVEFLLQRHSIQTIQKGVHLFRVMLDICCMPSEQNLLIQ